MGWWSGETHGVSRPQTIEKGVFNFLYMFSNIFKKKTRKNWLCRVYATHSHTLLGKKKLEAFMAKQNKTKHPLLSTWWYLRCGKYKLIPLTKTKPSWALAQQCNLWHPQCCCTKGEKALHRLTMVMTPERNKLKLKMSLKTKISKHMKKTNVGKPITLVIKQHECNKNLKKQILE